MGKVEHTLTPYIAHLINKCSVIEIIHCRTVRMMSKSHTEQLVALLPGLSINVYQFSCVPIHLDVTACIFHTTIGEFGIVYKAHYVQSSSKSRSAEPQIVAVKTLKGGNIVREVTTCVLHLQLQ